MSLAHYDLERPIQALATPRGRGAIAVLRVSGPGSLDLLESVFSRPKALHRCPGHQVLHGWILDSKGIKLDEVLVTVFRRPASYTGQDSAEISCHGGVVTSDRISSRLREVGFFDAEPGEFTFRAFASGKMDLTRAEAVQEIVDARTDRARSMAVSRLSGSVARAIDGAKELLLSQAAVSSLALDYPDDEVDQIPFDQDSLVQARTRIDGLLQTWSMGKIYHDGLKVVLAGPANAGKSSLFNLFLREERSIVTEIPGTTRDWVESWVAIQDIPIRLYDTAGLREHSDDPVEQEGIRRTKSLLETADIILSIDEGGDSEMFLPEEWEMDSRLLRVRSKIDLGREIPEGFYGISVVDGTGFRELEQAIVAKAFSGGLPPEGDAPIIDSARQKDLLEQAGTAIDRALEGLDDHTPVDLIAEDIRDALDALGQLTGEVSSMEILERLFSDFCVGK